MISEYPGQIHHRSTASEEKKINDQQLRYTTGNGRIKIKHDPNGSEAGQFGRRTDGSNDKGQGEGTHGNRQGHQCGPRHFISPTGMSKAEQAHVGSYLGELSNPNHLTARVCRVPSSRSDLSALSKIALSSGSCLRTPIPFPRPNMSPVQDGPNNARSWP